MTEKSSFKKHPIRQRKAIVINKNWPLTQIFEDSIKDTSLNLMPKLGITISRVENIKASIKENKPTSANI